MRTAHRVLGLDYEFHRGGKLGISYQGRSVMISVNQVGLNEEIFKEVMMSKTYRKLSK